MFIMCYRGIVLARKSDRFFPPSLPLIDKSTAPSDHIFVYFASLHYHNIVVK